MNRSRVTIRDVARAAGVSTASVSRALSGRRPVTPEVERAVRRAALTLGYQPNSVAQALRRQSTRIVGMVVPSIANPFFPHLVSAVEGALQQSDLGLLLSDSQESLEVERLRIADLLSRQVDGLIVAPVGNGSRHVLQDAAERLPLIHLDRFLAGIGSDFVGIDDRHGLQLLIDHLSEAGARRLAFVGAEADSASTARIRLEAYCEFSEELDAANPSRVMLGDFTLAWGMEAGSQIGRQASSIDAIVCANDLIAMGVMRSLRQLSVNVPDDVLVTGFDGIDLSGVVEPALTTVAQPFEEIGRRSTELLAGRLEDGSVEPSCIHVEPTLVIEASTTGESGQAGLR